MCNRTTISLARRNAHLGMATLEFVMALPVLLLLIVAIVWLGFTGIGQTEVMVEARNKAWARRFENASKNPLSFHLLPEHELPILPKYVASADYITETVGKTVDVSPIFKGIASPNGSHTILAGSWDYEAMPLNKPPDFQLMGKAALLGTFGSLLDLATLLRDPLGLVKLFGRTKGEVASVTDNYIRNEQSQVGKGGEASGDGSGTGPGPGGSGGMTAEEAEAKSKEDLEREKKQLKDRFKAIGGAIVGGQVRPQTGELEAANDAIIDGQLESQTKSKAARDEQDEERKKQLQEEAARADRKMQLARITYKRLEAECLDVAKAAEALDISQYELNGLVGYFGF